MANSNEKILENTAAREFIEQSLEIEGLSFFSWVYIDQKTAEVALHTAKKAVAEYLSGNFGISLSKDIAAKVEYSAGWYRLPLSSGNGGDIADSCIHELGATITGIPFSYPLVVIERIDEHLYAARYQVTSSAFPNLLRARIQKAIMQDKSLQARVSKLEEIFQNLSNVQKV